MGNAMLPLLSDTTSKSEKLFLKWNLDFCLKLKLKCLSSMSDVIIGVPVGTYDLSCGMYLFINFT